MSYIDVSGKTVEEALAKALTQLQMDRDDVSVRVLERAKSGFLGMGAKPARVRVTYGPDEAPVEADLVLGVPDSGVPAALGYSEASGIPFTDGIVKNRYVGRTFIQPTQAMRQLGIRLS